MNEESAFVLQGGVSAVAIAFLQQAVLRMIPYAAPSIVLIALDLLWGIRAAKCRGERARLSTAVRRSVTKTFSYVCWLVLATTMAVAFGQNWIEWAILGLVYVNELSSIVGNYLETKGLKVNWRYVADTVFRLGGQKVGVDASDVDSSQFVEPIRKPKPGRNEKEQFVKKGGKK